MCFVHMGQNTHSLFSANLSVQNTVTPVAMCTPGSQLDVIVIFQQQNQSLLDKELILGLCRKD